MCTALPYGTILYLLLSSTPSTAQSILDILGHPANAKLLIVHADDLAVTHSENTASFAALDSGLVNSGSIMAPCPWLPEVAEWVKSHPDHDLGMHLTLTSEWGPLKWGPVAGAARVPSLVDEAGYFYPDCATMAEHARPEEVRVELRAQIERAITLGIHPTHLDSHMGCLVYTSPAIFQAYLDLSREYGIPPLLGKHELASPAFQHLADRVAPQDLVLDRIYTATPPDYQGGMSAYYEGILKELAPGTISTILIHCAFDNAEGKGAHSGHEAWGARWRQQDFDYFTSATARRLLKAQGITLVTWGELNATWQAYWNPERE